MSTWQERSGALVAVAGFAVFAWVLAHRLTNGWYGEVEFTGWSNPLATRLLAGEAAYRDFLAPIPPGSWYVLAALQWVWGRPLLLQELLVCGASHLTMGVLGAAALWPLVGARLALLTMPATLALVATFNKECAYDHTAQVVAWSSIAAGSWALTATAPPSRRRLLVVTGVLAGLTHLFKQSTGVGVSVGFGVALAGLAAFPGPGRATRRSALQEVALFLLGLALGLGATVALVALSGASVPGFVEMVYREGSRLKGGSGRLVQNLVAYLIFLASHPSSLLLVAVTALAAAQASRHPAGFSLTDPAGGPGPRSTALLLGVAGAWFAAVAAYVAYGPPGLPPRMAPWTDALKQVPAMALPLLALSLVAAARSGKGTEPRTRERALLGVATATFATSLLHNTSAPEFRGFYDNNPILPLAVAALLAFGYRMRGGAVLGPLLYAALLLSVLCNRIDRAAAADRLVTEGYWAGLRVAGAGSSLHEVAEVVRRHSSPGETALVLPEDLALAPALGRPRPPLRGAVLFVDQYPAAALEHDLAVLRKSPPRVVVLHPAEELVWQNLHRIWSSDSPAERLLRWVRSELLPSYRRVDVRRTNFLGAPTTLEVWVRRDGDREGGE